MSEYREHPAATIFPLLEGQEFDEFVADIKANGLRDPIVIWRDMILDGRNRLRACEAAGVAPQYREWNGEDPVEFVISANLHRRHLNAVQRAAIAAKLENMKWGGDRRSDQNVPGRFDQNPVNRQQVADLMKISQASVDRASLIYDKGSPQQVADMEKGTLPLRPTTEKIRQKTARAKQGRGPRSDRTAKYEPETERQRQRAQGQKDRMVQSLSTIRGHCRGLSQFDIGMAISACSREDMKTWAKLARDNARVLNALAHHLEKECTYGTKVA